MPRHSELAAQAQLVLQSRGRERIKHHTLPKTLVLNHITGPSVPETLRQGHQSKQHIYGTPFLKTKLGKLCFSYDTSGVRGSPLAEKLLPRHKSCGEAGLLIGFFYDTVVVRGSRLLIEVSPTRRQLCGEARLLKGSFSLDAAVVPGSAHGENRIADASTNIAI